MSVPNLDEVFNPRSIALIGATDRGGSVGAVILRNLLRAQFHGELLLVNRHHQTLHGMSLWPDVASLPHPPDLAVIVTPSDTVTGGLNCVGIMVPDIGLDASSSHLAPGCRPPMRARARSCRRTSGDIAYRHACRRMPSAFCKMLG
jgi:acyl-CoA synthetase (NDP forming)